MQWIVRGDLPGFVNTWPLLSCAELEAEFLRRIKHADFFTKFLTVEQCVLIRPHIVVVEMYLQICSSINSTPQMCRNPLQSAMLNHDEIGAFSYIFPEVVGKRPTFIGVYSATSFVYLDIYMRIMSDPSNFPEIGDISLERSGRSKLAFLPTKISQLSHDVCIPMCPVRIQFAMLLHLIVMDFFFCHELTHIINGHLDLLQRRNELRKKGFIDSTGAVCDRLPSDDLEDCILRQTLEMDADAGAAQKVLQKWLEVIDRPAPNGIGRTMCAAMSNAKSVTRVVEFALYTAIRCCGVSWTPGYQEKKTHPDHAVRLTLLGGLIARFVEVQRGAMGGYLPNDYAVDALETVRMAEAACGSVMSNETDYRVLNSVRDNPASNNYHDLLNRTWQTIKPELDKYKRGGGLAD